MTWHDQHKVMWRMYVDITIPEILRYYLSETNKLSSTLGPVLSTYRKWWSTYTNIWLVTTNSIGQGPHQWWWVWWKEKIWEDCSQYCTQHSHYTQFLHSPLIEFRHLKVSPSLPPLGTQYTVRDKIIHLPTTVLFEIFPIKWWKMLFFPW